MAGRLADYFLDSAESIEPPVRLINGDFVCCCLRRNISTVFNGVSVDDIICRADSLEQNIRMHSLKIPNLPLGDVLRVFLASSFQNLSHGIDAINHEMPLFQFSACRFHLHIQSRKYYYYTFTRQLICTWTSGL